MKFYASTTAILSSSVNDETELQLVITAQYRRGYSDSFMGPGEPATCEVLRVEVRDPKTKTLHMLPEYLVDVLTDNDETRTWLLNEWAEQDQCARDDAADMRREDRQVA